MDRRTHEGPMEWEYQDKIGPVDASSPFAQVSQRSFMASSFATDSPSRSAARPASNPFANIGNRSGAAARPTPPSPSKQSFGRPPSSSVFNAPAVKSFPAASPFRNPSFTTPQKRANELFSECSGAEESPAVQSDVSMMEADDTPELERFDRDFAHATITPASAVNRKLFDERRQRAEIPDTPDSVSNSSHQTEKQVSSRPTSSHAAGRGEVPRGKLDYIFGRRDRIRKRKRQQGDRDVGSVRARAHGASTSDESEDDSDVSEWATDGDKAGGSRRSRGRRGQLTAGKGGVPRRGVIGNMFSVIHDHPNVPVILSWWVQLGMNVFFMAVVMWFVWGGISMMRADISHAADAARSRLLAQMNECAHDYTKNRCAPKSERLPALNVMCNEWEVCMNQDPSSVMKMQVSAKNVAEIINEFVGVMSFKAWGFILSAMLAVILASNMGFSRFRDSAFVDQPKANVPGPHAYASQPAGAPTPSLPSSQDPNQAYIWAPIGQTPRHIRRGYMLQPDTPTDTDGSPDAPRAAIMAPPKTPSLRRSPSKGERGHSPSKFNRSPHKGY